MLEFHRQLFATGTASLRAKIRGITGMELRDVTAEVEPTTGSVVQVFMTDRVAEDFLRSRRALAGQSLAVPAAIAASDIELRYTVTRHARDAELPEDAR